MRNVFAGVIAALALFSAFAAWRWNEAVEREADLEVALAAVRETVAEQQRTIQHERDRISLLDKSITELTSQRSEIQKALGVILKSIEDLPRSEGDTDASFNCLDQPLPRAAADLMRDPAAARSANADRP